MNIKATIREWTHGPDWKTWVAHSVIALLIFVLPAIIFSPAIGAASAIGYYLIRELEQLLYGYVDNDLDKDWLDHILDVVCPSATVLLVTAICTIL